MINITIIGKYQLKHKKLKLTNMKINNKLNKSMITNLHMSFK